MYLKVVEGYHNAMYECDEITIDTLEKDKGFHLYLILYRYGVAGPVRTVEVPKSVDYAVGVYLMSNQGKTIDTIFAKDDNAKVA